MWQGRGTSVGSRLRGRHAARVVLCAVAVLTACSPTASAGTYTVLSCKDRSWDRAPLNDASGGWTGGSTGGMGLDWLDNATIRRTGSRPR